jgi:ATP-dependent exoDNAse (exonuclease V) beta subunit
MSIRFTSAGAGSGKTHRVTEVIEQRLASGACRPAGLIATTFTVKAAQELRERLRRRLYRNGHNTQAERLDEAFMGTVHSVCRQLLERFAFDAGISPRVQVLEEEQAAELLSQTAESVMDFATLEELQELAALLGQQDWKSKASTWKTHVKSIIAASQANDIMPEALPRMAERSVNELIAFLPPLSANHLDAELHAALKTAIAGITAGGDDTKGTEGYLELLRDCLRDLENERLPWSAWVKLSKAQPTKASRPAAAPVTAIAAQFENHPRLREHIRKYVTTLFSLAQLGLTEFGRLKEERGLLDFADLEQRALHLFQNGPSVKEVLRQELDLLVVDEFQDTSPIQLALFTELASCAQETVWVGDVKQSIFEFRSSDPVLINAVIAEVKRSGGLNDPLDHSYRSVSELVRLANALFVPAFGGSLGLPENQVRLIATREQVRPAQAAVEFLDLTSGQTTKKEATSKRLTNEQFAATLAERVTQWLDSPDRPRIADRESQQPRLLELRDIAILCRTNDDAARLAGSLSARGFPVNLAESGMLATPEGRLALASLRCLADPADTLAVAEIIALQATLAPEQWLEQRLVYLEQLAELPESSRADRWGLEEPFTNPAVQALERARSALLMLSPSEALDIALEAGNVFATVSSWGPDSSRSAQRRANLESLRAMAVNYEQVSATNHLPATLAGFLFWCDDLANNEADAKGLDANLNAIHVSTYHKAKGLEWPMVVCTGFDTEPKARLWGLTVTADDPSKAFLLAQPLANRRLRFWVWPFGTQKTGVGMTSRVDASPVGQQALRVATQEELRLLYVGFTRAREYLVIARDAALTTPWLDLLKAAWLRPSHGRLKLPDSSILPAKTVTVTLSQQIAPPKPEPSYFWFPARVPRTPKADARVAPSRQTALKSAAVGRIIDLRARLSFTGHPNEADLGDAIHAILATEFIHPNHHDREVIAERILRGYGFESLIKAEDVLAMADRVRARLLAEFQPKLILVETPFDCQNELGQRLVGFMDLLLKTDQGWVVFDHKTFPGKKSEWQSEAISYSGQLAIYRAALESLSQQVAGTWIHFAVGGGLVEVV